SSSAASFLQRSTTQRPTRIAIWITCRTNCAKPTFGMRSRTRSGSAAPTPLSSSNATKVPERESLEVDVLVVGAGPAGLAAAYHLRRLNKDLSIAVLEKGKEIGAHIISGAVMDPRGINELMPDWKEKGAPIEKPVEEDHVVFLTEKRKFELPIVPAPLQNHGNYIISLNRFTRWFGQQVEQSGVDLFAGFAGAELLIEDDSLVGVRTGDKGIDKSGKAKSNFEPGI